MKRLAFLGAICLALGTLAIAPAAWAAGPTCTITGTDGNDTLTGTSGNDVMCGLAGNDMISGMDGDDWIDGGAGNDVVSGGMGNDTLLGHYQPVNLGSEGDFVCGVEADRLEGDDGTDNLFGGVGDDTLDGGMGTDSESGGWCNDTFLQGSAPNGNDNMTGGSNVGPDVDTVSYAGRTGNVNVSINDPGLQDGEAGEGDHVVNIANVVGGSGNDTLTGDAWQNVLDGGAGNDSLGGKAGYDTLNGGTGNDSMIGGTGVDTLNGGEGSDSIAGNEDGDTAYGNQGDDTIDGGKGLDFLYGGVGNDTMYAQMPGACCVGAQEQLYGQDGNDYLFGIDSKLYGNAGDDTLDMGCASPSSRAYGNGGPGFDIALINAGYPFLVDIEQVGC
jgi:Ca2+-binding RTX toxin-like protein